MATLDRPDDFLNENHSFFAIKNVTDRQTDGPTHHPSDRRTYLHIEMRKNTSKKNQMSYLPSASVERREIQLTPALTSFKGITEIYCWSQMLL